MTIKSIYLVESKNNKGLPIYKIGKATDLKHRLSALKTQSPVSMKLVSSFMTHRADEIELQIHKAFAKHRSHGEWFLLEDWQVSWVSSFGDFYLDKNMHELSASWLRKHYLETHHGRKISIHNIW